MVATGVWLGALALASAAAVGGVVYATRHQGGGSSPSPAPLPPAPGPVPGPQPSALPQTGDVYNSLSAAQQSAVLTALYSYIIKPGACPTVFAQGQAQVTSQGINSASDLTDPTNRQIAVDCFQQGQNVGQTIGAGVLDVQTYQKLMGL